MINHQSVASHVFPMCKLTVFSVDEILLLKYVNSSTIFCGLPLKVETALFCLKCMNIEANTTYCLLQAMK